MDTTAQNSSETSREGPGGTCSPNIKQLMIFSSSLLSSLFSSGLTVDYQTLYC